MAYHETREPDSAWTIAIAQRRGVLWLGSSINSRTIDDLYSLIPILVRPWHSVYADTELPPDLLERAQESRSIDPLTFRLINGDPDDRGKLASNRIPVYQIPDCDPTDDPMRFAARLKMFQRLPLQASVFVLSQDPASDTPTVLQALRTAGEVQELVLISLKSPDAELPAERLVHWVAGASEFTELLSEITPPSDRLSRVATVAIRTDRGVRAVDLSKAIDASYPITDRFELVPASAVLGSVEPSPEHVMQLLASPTSSWDPYASGVVFNRTYHYEKDALKLCQEVSSSGPEAASTYWINAQQASGTTTMLRDLLLRIARTGLPVLVGRPESTSFDFQQLSSFLRSATNAAEDAGAPLANTPWVVAFDAEHTLLCDDFVCGLANGLRKLNRHALVIAVRPSLARRDAAVIRAVGRERTAREPMLNLLSQQEAEAFGSHLNNYLPTHQQRRNDEWREFAIESERLTGDGKQSLFWLALRFWLMRLPGADQPLRQWLSSQITASLRGHEDRLVGVLIVAVLSRHRLACPARLLNEHERKALRPLLDDLSHPLGLRELWGERRGSFAIAHPLLAEEMLRICASDSDCLRDAGISRCAGLLDFELQLFARILSRDEVGLPEVVPVVEELVVSGLRVDSREAPQNYSAREQIVAVLESVPDAVFDTSPIFLHHLAKARRHLAADPPPSDFWHQPKVRREQLELAEGHLLDALSSDHVQDEERQEKPLNLHVSLALTYSVRADLEKAVDDGDAADKFASRAQAEYQHAQSLDPDNTYVLENYARLKLRAARETSDEDERLRLLVEAISLLEWELAVDEIKRREHAVMESLASAYSMLEDKIGLAKLDELANSGSEAAAVGLARIVVRREPDDGGSTSQEQLREAIGRLQRIPAAHVTWRSRQCLYELVSEAFPYGFAQRLEPLDELNAMADFPWPLQRRLEYAILLYQLGRREDGRRVFKELRDSLATRSGALRIPPELKYLADPKSGFKSPMRTALRVTNATSVGRNYYGVPEGWGAVDIPFRPYLFGRREIRRNDDLDCLIQFTTFGPQAVPPTEL